MPRLGSKDLPRLMRCRELEFEFRSWIRVFIGGIGGILVIPTELGLEEEEGEGEGEGGGGFGRSRGRATFSTISIFCVCVCVRERASHQLNNTPPPWSPRYFIFSHSNSFYQINYFIYPCTATLFLYSLLFFQINFP